MDMDDNEELLYIFPRSDSVVIGGTAQVWCHCHFHITFQHGKWDTTVDPNTTKRILELAEQVIPGIKQAKVKAEWVGLRPGRTQVRLEEDAIADSNKKRKITVIHK
jgi:glycine/D-amino acid oxidase-like deaminating enzyme